MTVVERINRNKPRDGVVPMSGAPVMMIPQPLLDPLVCPQYMYMYVLHDVFHSL